MNDKYTKKLIELAKGLSREINRCSIKDWPKVLQKVNQLIGFILALEEK